MARGRAIYLCGDVGPAATRETDCPNALHDWPLPSGYTDAGEEADRRIRKRWANRKCPECGRFGWVPGLNVSGTTAELFEPQTIDRPQRTARGAS